MSNNFKGIHWSEMPNKEEIREHIRATKLRQSIKPWLGKKLSETMKRKISIGRKGKNTGEKNHNWKGGITPEHNKLRGSLEYIIWRNEVYKRDNWTCRICGIKCMKGNIIAHHLKKFADYPELRFVIENGLTLCRKCHREIEPPNTTHT